MDLLSIGQTIFRHKLATLPVIILMVVGTVYVVKLKPSVYKTSASYILVNPPAPPTDEQINRDPALGRIHTNNPYVNYGDLSIVSSLLTQTLTTDPLLSKLVREGADSRFTVGPNMAYSLSTPLVQVTGIASSAARAALSVRLVGGEMKTELASLQAAQGTDPRYFIKTQELTPPGPAQEQLSGKLRLLIAVLALGVIMLFVVVSVMTALEERRARRTQWDLPEFPLSDDDVWQVPRVADRGRDADIETVLSDRD